MSTTKYDGDASVSPYGKKVRVWIEAPNFKGEVYVSRKKAREIRDSLVHILRPGQR